jgi:hypothetical protein
LRPSSDIISLILIKGEMSRMGRFLHTKPISVVAVGFLALGFAGTLFAQAGATSQISGVVRDPSGSAVPEAQVKATQTDTGIVRTTQTGPDGAYVLPNLPIGAYRLEVSKQGFQTTAQQFTLQVATSPTVDVTLQIGAATQEVVVEAAAAGVDTTTSGVGQVIDQRRVVDLPLDGRNPTELIYLAGAAAQAPNADLVSTKAYTSEVPISIGGGLANGALYQLDGGNHNDPSNNLALPLPFPDAMQEFNVQTSALPAQYGQHSAGVVNVVTKSGTNDFHGDLFEFLRNGDLNARNFFATSRDSLKRNQYGGTIGGPIKKDKLFFFAGYQAPIFAPIPPALLPSSPRSRCSMAISRPSLPLSARAPTKPSPTPSRRAAVRQRPDLSDGLQPRLHQNDELLYAAEQPVRTDLFRHQAELR